MLAGGVVPTQWDKNVFDLGEVGIGLSLTLSSRLRPPSRP
jgi:hypothetical protein